MATHFTSRKSFKNLIKLVSVVLFCTLLFSSAHSQDYVFNRGNFSGWYTGSLNLCVVDKNEYYGTYTANSKVVVRKYKNGNVTDYGDNSAFPNSGGAGDIVRDPASGTMYISFFNTAYDQIYTYKWGSTDNNWTLVSTLNKPASYSMGYALKLVWNENSAALFMAFSEQTSSKVYFYELVSGTWTNRTGASTMGCSSNRMDISSYGNKVIISTSPSSALQVHSYDVTTTALTRLSTSISSNVAGFVTTAYDDVNDTYVSFYGQSTPWMGLKVVKSVAGAAWTDMSGTTLTGAMDNGSWGGYITYNKLTQKFTLVYSSSSLYGYTWNGSDWVNISIPYMGSTNTLARLDYKDFYFVGWSGYTQVGVYSTNETPRRNTTNITATANGVTAYDLSFPKRGDGHKVVVFAKQGTSYTAPVVVNNTTYTANATFGSGTQLGTSGWYCIYNGVGDALTLSGLTGGQDYMIQAFEYNGLTGTEMYSPSTAVTGNPISVLGVTLPVNWLSFTGRAIHGDVELNWSTASELNNSHFEIQRSANAIDFSAIGSVAAGTNPSVVNNYQFLDLNPLSGTSYYRLKQVDIDGKYSFSSIIQINGTPLSEIKIYSDAEALHLLVPASVSGSSIAFIYDVAGRLIQKQQVLPGRNIISTAGLSGGNYFVQLVNGGKNIYSNKFVK